MTTEDTKKTESTNMETMTEDAKEFLELLKELSSNEKREARAYMSGLRDARLLTA